MQYLLSAAWGLLSFSVFCADGLICLRLVVDDHLWWWGEKEAPGTTRLLPIMGWNGRCAHFTPVEQRFIQHHLPLHRPQ